MDVRLRRFRLLPHETDDHRGQRARASLPDVKQGIFAGAGGAIDLPLRLAGKRATKLLLAGDPVGAGTAQRWGLINAVVVAIALASGGHERGDRGQGVPLVFGVPDLGQGLLRAGMGGLRERAEHVGDLVEPASLLPRGGEHLAQRTPEPECAVADREDRGAHAPAGGVTQQVRPGLRAFAVAVGERDEFLCARSARTPMSMNR